MQTLLQESKSSLTERQKGVQAMLARGDVNATVMLYLNSVPPEDRAEVYEVFRAFGSLMFTHGYHTGKLGLGNYLGILARFDKGFLNNDVRGQKVRG